jgi:hypothetical protein
MFDECAAAHLSCTQKHNVRPAALASSRALMEPICFKAFRGQQSVVGGARRISRCSKNVERGQQAGRNLEPCCAPGGPSSGLSLRTRKSLITTVDSAFREHENLCKSLLIVVTLVITVTTSDYNCEHTHTHTHQVVYALSL